MNKKRKNDKDSWIARHINQIILAGLILSIFIITPFSKWKLLIVSFFPTILVYGLIVSAIVLVISIFFSKKK